MVVEFVEEFARLLAFEPESVKVEVVPHEDFYEIVIYAKKADVGRIIGKEGSMVKAIKTVISGCRAKENKNYKITVKAEDE
ncbi:KH domain-containing protein [Nautilia sp.]